MPIYRLENSIQNYAWGSYSAIANLLGNPSPCCLPQAELWMGTHPKTPSNVLTEFGKCSLTELIKKNPVDVLGEQTFRKFGGELPYLFKILAMDKPLSIQVHPNKKQAISGYYKEDCEKKSIDCPERNYKDQNHKLECMFALTSLWSLNGFRNIAEMQLLISKICPDVVHNFFEMFLKESNELGLENFIRNVASLSKKDVKLAIAQALPIANQLRDNSLVFEWVCRLADIYPDDISVFTPIVLNLIQLEPGQAIFIPEGVIHTYIKGIGIELMVNSDNVLRAGLTDKHVDILDVLNVVEFVEKKPYLINAQIVRPYEAQYKTNALEFLLTVVSVTMGQLYFAPRNRSIEILLCTYGRGLVIDTYSNLALEVKQGESLVVTASVPSYVIQGEVTIFKAGVPLPTK